MVATDSLSVTTIPYKVSFHHLNGFDFKNVLMKNYLIRSFYSTQNQESRKHVNLTPSLSNQQSGIETGLKLK